MKYLFKIQQSVIDPLTSLMHLKPNKIRSLAYRQEDSSDPNRLPWDIGPATAEAEQTYQAVSMYHRFGQRSSG